MIEKIIKAGTKDVGIKCPASFPIRYKSKYGRDFFEDIVKLSEDSGNLSRFANVIYEMAHMMASYADPNIPKAIEDWLDTFEEFPVFDIATEVIKFANETVISKKVAEQSEKNAEATEN